MTHHLGLRVSNNDQIPEIEALVHTIFTEHGLTIASVEHDEDCTVTTAGFYEEIRMGSSNGTPVGFKVYQPVKDGEVTYIQAKEGNPIRVCALGEVNFCNARFVFSSLPKEVYGKFKKTLASYYETHLF